MRARAITRLLAIGVVSSIAWGSLCGAAFLTVSLTRPAFAQTADVVLEDLNFGIEGITYRAPRVEFRGTRLSKAELIRLLDEASPEPLGSRIGQLEAASIVVPEIVSTTTTPQGRQTTTYRDALFTKVAGGRIASAQADGGTIEATTDKGVAKGQFGRLSMDDLDLNLALRLFASGGAAGQPMGRVYGGFAMDAMVLTDPSGVTTRIGRMAGRDFSARPTAAGWMGTMQAFTANPDLKSASPEVRRRSLEALTELLSAFSFGVMEATGITFEGRDSAGPRGRLDRVSVVGGTDAKLGEIRIEGFEAGSSDGRVRFGSLVFGGLSAKPLLAFLQDLSSSPSGEPSPASLRKLIPIIGSIGISGFETELPGSRAGLGSEGIRPVSRVSLGQVEFVTGKPIDGVPTDIRLAIQHVAFPVPSNSDNDGLKQLASLGYEKVDTSVVMSLGWNETSQEIALREVSVDGADMGAFILRGVIGNASRDLFNPDSAVAAVAALGATAKSAEIGLENRGLFERIVAREARRQKRNPEDIRREYGMTASVGIPAILGSSPGAKALAQAVAKFVAKPGRLVIKAQAKQATGYGVADFAAGPDPASVLSAIDVTATAD